jgi:simple sugar transport system permease protein
MIDPIEALGASVRIGTPLLLAGLGEFVLERAGMINIGIEGVMLCGAYAGFHAGWAAHSPLAGAVCGMLAGAVFMLFYAGMTISLRADQIVTGMALNLLATGLTGTAYAVLRENQTAALDAPRFAPLFLTQSPLTWLALLLVPLLWFYFERSERGLELRACGENPEAARAAGISVARARLKACLACGVLSGLAGAFLTVSETGSFAANCTGGRGFIALAAVVLGRYRTFGTAAACLFFGATFYVRDAIPSEIVPSELLDMLPYVLTLAALCWKFSQRAAPEALGKA